MLFSTSQAVVIVIIIFIIILLLFFRLKGKQYTKRAQNSLKQVVVSLYHRMDSPSIQPVNDPTTTLGTIKTNAIASLQNLDPNLANVSNNNRYVLMDLNSPNFKQGFKNKMKEQASSQITKEILHKCSESQINSSTEWGEYLEKAKRENRNATPLLALAVKVKIKFNAEDFGNKVVQVPELEFCKLKESKSKLEKLIKEKIEEYFKGGSSPLFDYSISNYKLEPSISQVASDIYNNTFMDITIVIRPFDKTPPTFDLLGEDTMTINLGEQFNDPGYSNPTDNIDENVSVVVTGSVDTSIPGEYKLIYNATDSSGNKTILTRTVIVVPPNAPVNQPPIITLNPADTTITILNDEPFNLPIATATDVEDGNITNNVTYTIEPLQGLNVGQNSHTVGNYTITYSVTDSGNLSDNKVVAVIVNPVPVNTAPNIQLKGTDNVILEYGETFNNNSTIWSDPGVTVSDLEDTNLSEDNVIVSPPGFIMDTLSATSGKTETITYSVTDSEGLTATVTRLITLKPALMPIVTLETAVLPVNLNSFKNQGFPSYQSGVFTVKDKLVKVRLDAINWWKDFDGDGIPAKRIDIQVSDPKWKLFGNDGIALDLNQTLNSVINTKLPLTLKYDFNNTKPVISLIEPTMDLGTGETFSDPGYTITDPNEFNPTVTLKPNVDITYPDSSTGWNPANLQPGKYELVYTVTDTHGAVSDPKIRTINVKMMIIVEGYYGTRNTQTGGIDVNIVDIQEEININELPPIITEQNVPQSVLTSVMKVMDLFQSIRNDNSISGICLLNKNNPSQQLEEDNLGQIILEALNARKTVTFVYGEIGTVYTVNPGQTINRSRVMWVRDTITKVGDLCLDINKPISQVKELVSNSDSLNVYGLQKNSQGRVSQVGSLSIEDFANNYPNNMYPVQAEGFVFILAKSSDTTDSTYNIEIPLDVQDATLLPNQKALYDSKVLQNGTFSKSYPNTTTLETIRSEGANFYGLPNLILKNTGTDELMPLQSTLQDIAYLLYNYAGVITGSLWDNYVRLVNTSTTDINPPPGPAPTQTTFVNFPPDVQLEPFPQGADNLVFTMKRNEPPTQPPGIPPASNVRTLSNYEQNLASPNPAYAGGMKMTKLTNDGVNVTEDDVYKVQGVHSDPAVCYSVNNDPGAFFYGSLTDLVACENPIPKKQQFQFIQSQSDPDGYLMKNMELNKCMSPLVNSFTPPDFKSDCDFTDPSLIVVHKK